MNKDAKPAEDTEVKPVKKGPEDAEFRSFIASELRSDTESGKIVGYAAVFNEESLPIGGLFREVIRPGAFAKTIKEADIRALKNHNADYVLGRNKANTLDLREDDKGLLISITPPDTQWARDLQESIKRGDINQMSFMFRTIKDNWYETEDELRRELLEVHLYEVSPVTFPAYPQTSVGVRDVYKRAVAQAANSLAGVSDVKVFKAMMRLQANEELRAEELELLNAFAANLQKKLSLPEPAVRHSSIPEPASGHSVEKLRAQLKLIEIQEELK